MKDLVGLLVHGVEACTAPCPASTFLSLGAPHGGGQALTKKSNSTESWSRGGGTRIPPNAFVKHPTTSVETAPPGDTITSDNAPDAATLASTYAVPCVPREAVRHPSAALFNSACTPSRFASSNR